jgi:hypothetical protein
VALLSNASLSSLRRPAVVVVWHPNPGVQLVHGAVIESVALSSNLCRGCWVSQCWRSGRGELCGITVVSREERAKRFRDALLDP